ncbi:MAG: DUF2508 family protein [Oscillospiraceae bacterium]|nr:DUF2508 family protein [Oscillospiraceae bacterium]
MLNKNVIQDELNQLSQRMQNQELLFDLADDDDLIDAIIYEQKSLYSRYTYLIKKAKAESLHMDYVERKSLEKCGS